MRRLTVGGAMSGLLGLTMLVTATTAAGAEAVLKRGTEIPAVVVQNLSVEKNGIGETVYFRTTEDVTVSGDVVLTQGTLIRGRVGEVHRGKGLSKRGELTLFAETTTAIDGSPVPLEKVALGALGNTGEGSGLRDSLVWGGLSARSKYRPSYVLNGTPYNLTVADDVTVNPDKPELEPPRKQRTIRMEGKVVNAQKVKLFKGRTTKELVRVLIHLPQRVSKKRARRGFGPDDVNLVRMMEEDLPRPVGAALVKLNKKKLIAEFEAWEVLQYAVPGKIGLVIQVDMGGDQMGEVDITLDADFAL